MALATVPPFPWPSQPFWRSGATGLGLGTSTMTIDSSADRGALIFRAPKTGTLDRMEFNITGGTALQDLRVGWQDINLATGFPDGSFDQYADLTGYTTGWQVPAYFGDTGGGSGSKRSVTKGDYICFVITSTGGAPNITVTTLSTSGASAPKLPAWCTNTSGSYVVASSVDAICSLYYDGEADATPINWYTMGAHTYTTASISTAAVEQAGLKFTIPFAARCVGALFMVDADADLNVRLYDSPTNDLLASAMVHDKDIVGAASASGFFEVQFPTSLTLSAGSTYRLVLENTGATNCAIRYGGFNDNGDVAGSPGGKNAFWTESTLVYASLVDEASWTDRNTRMPFFALILDALDDGAGGGGGGGNVNIMRGKL